MTWLSLLYLIATVVVLRVLLRRSSTSSMYILKKWRTRIDDVFNGRQCFKVPEFDANAQANQLYRKVHSYVNSLAAIEDSDTINLYSGKKQNEIVLELDVNQAVHDEFLGSELIWINEVKDEKRTFVLKIRKNDKRRIFRPYLQHIYAISDDIDSRRKGLKLYMNIEDENGKEIWRSVPFTHPASVDTIAMGIDLKNKLKSDFETFLKSKQYYHRLGRVWKRSYLLYGPSGSGKSSFIAAMANFLNYDVYNIDLSRISRHPNLMELLLLTTVKSIIVIEDLDRFLTEKSTPMNLSWLLNFMDGIPTSCCSDERIFVYTMTSKDAVESALLRPGRIDVRINFPRCDFHAFKALANNYLRIKDHKLFPQVEEILHSRASLSPAEIGELMLVNRNSPSRAIKSVIGALEISGDRRGSGKIIRRLSESGSTNSVEELVASSPYDADTVDKERPVPTSDFRKLHGFFKPAGDLRRWMRPLSRKKDC